MSGFDAELLSCSECEEQWAFGPAAIYRTPELQAQGLYPPVLKDRVWCWQCERPRHAERVPSAAEFHRAAAIRRIVDFRLPAHVEDELLEVGDSDFEFLYTHLSTRPPRGQCLHCGGGSWLRLEVAVDLVVNLRHPLCGGHLHFRKVFITGHANNPPSLIRWLAPDGNVLNPDEDVGP